MNQESCMSDKTELTIARQIAALPAAVWDA
jgi:hypothetical protein